MTSEIFMYSVGASFIAAILYGTWDRIWRKFQNWSLKRDKKVSRELSDIVKSTKSLPTLFHFAHRIRFKITMNFCFVIFLFLLLIIANPIVLFGLSFWITIIIYMLFTGVFTHRLLYIWKLHKTERRFNQLLHEHKNIIVFESRLL